MAEADLRYVEHLCRRAKTILALLQWRQSTILNGVRS